MIPMVSDVRPARMPTASDMRAPYKTPLNTSLPTLSVPKRCDQDGAARRSRLIPSGSWVASCGANTATSATSTMTASASSAARLALNRSQFCTTAAGAARSVGADVGTIVMAQAR